MTEIGGIIRAERQRQGMKIKELAELAGVDEATVGRIERGITKTPSSLDKLHKALGIGIYEQPEASTVDRDPRLSEATFSDLLGALAARYYSRETTEAGRPRQQGPSSSGLVVPQWDGSRYGSAEEARRGERPKETG